MRIQRNQSRLSFRKRRHSSGCLPLVILLGLLAGITSISWNWIGQWLSAAVSRQSGDDLIVAARQAFDEGDLDKAIELSRQALAAQPDHAEAVVLLARALVYRSYSEYDRAVDRDSALQATGEALQIMPHHPDVLAAHAFALQAAGRQAEAAEVARHALDLVPEHGLARTALALAYGGVGSFEISLRENLQAVQGSGWLLDAQRALAVSYSDLGDYENALTAVDRAISLNTRLVPLYFERALYALQVGDADVATAAYFQVLVYDSENAKARLRLCELSSLLRERDKAIRFCQQVTERAPAWADGWYHLGREYFLQGNFRLAQEHLHRCSSLQVMQDVPPEEYRFECWYLQGQAAEILGDCESLLATYNEFRAIAVDPAVQQTWTYPPEGPPGCSTSASPTP
jgi:tetratricopeptide (TPR) repeat protein